MADYSKLSREELLALKNELQNELNKVDFQLKVSPNKTDINLCYSVLIGEIKLLTGQTYPPFNMIPMSNRKNIKTMVNNLAIDMESLLKISYSEYTKQHLVIMYKLYVKIISDKLKEIGWEVNLLTILMWRNKFNSLFNQQFPGYIEYGLLPMLLNRGV